ncbi:MAG: ACP S-malonyltransferase [Methylacidiphilales bacterium]|nr:ACP S-malonyltransferase [Candidatus Methylacidiphilales bacterium]MDW8349853.1 ACP S-malonyltransferase [Verrucomicrobiae bacterium]
MLIKRAILFAGQGAQKVGMGADLYHRMPSIRALYEQADQILGYSISKISFEGPEGLLTQTAHCQPALYLHGYALHSLLVQRLPSLIITAYAGLSLGEYTAHAAAGTFSFSQGLRLVRSRAEFMQKACEATHGGMTALIGADEETARKIADQAGVDVANFNAPGQIVLSGESNRMQLLPSLAQQYGIKRVIPLNVAGAYHSRLMQSAQDALAPFIDEAQIEVPRVPVWANVHAQPVNTPSEIRQTLKQQITGSVKWEQTIRNLIQSGVQEFIELGPGGVLAGFCKRINPEVSCRSVATLEELERLIETISQ